MREICDVLSTRFPNGKWSTNREIPAKELLGVEKVVPDISGRVGNERLAIEAQVSSLSIPQIIKRSQIYAKRKIPILWIVPLKEPLGTAAFRPRLFERYLHAMYFGRVYYWQPGFGSRLLPIHYGVATRHIPFAEWYDKEAEEEREVGGYDKPYKVIKRPVAASQIDLATDFHSVIRMEFRPWNERKTVPSLVIWKDKMANWWDASEDAEFLKRFKEDNLPKQAQKEFQRPAFPNSHY